MQSKAQELMSKVPPVSQPAAQRCVPRGASLSPPSPPRFFSHAENKPDQGTAAGASPPAAWLWGGYPVFLLYMNIYTYIYLVIL